MKHITVTYVQSSRPLFMFFYFFYFFLLLFRFSWRFREQSSRSPTVFLPVFDNKFLTMFLITNRITNRSAKQHGNESN